MFKLVGMDILDASTPERPLQSPPVAESGNTACPFLIGLKMSAHTLNMIC
jgi:hypothetical protein